MSVGGDALKRVEGNHETHLLPQEYDIWSCLCLRSPSVPPSNLKVEILKPPLGLLPQDTLIVIFVCTFDLALSHEVDKKRLKQKRAEEKGGTQEIKAWKSRIKEKRSDHFTQPVGV